MPPTSMNAPMSSPSMGSSMGNKLSLHTVIIVLLLVVIGLLAYDIFGRDRVSSPSSSTSSVPSGQASNLSNPTTPPPAGTNPSVPPTEVNNTLLAKVTKVGSDTLTVEALAVPQSASAPQAGKTFTVHLTKTTTYVYFKPVAKPEAGMPPFEQKDGKLSQIEKGWYAAITTDAKGIVKDSLTATRVEYSEKSPLGQ